MKKEELLSGPMLVYYFSLGLCVAIIWLYDYIEPMMFGYHTFPVMREQVLGYTWFYACTMIVLGGLQALLGNSGIEFRSPLGIPLFLWCGYLFFAWAICSIEPDWQTPALTVWFFLHVPVAVGLLLLAFVKTPAEETGIKRRVVYLLERYEGIAVTRIEEN